MPKYIKEILTDLKGEIDNKIIGGDFNTLLSIINRLSRWKINKKTLHLNFRKNGPNKQHLSFNSSIIHILPKHTRMDHKASPSTLKKTEIIPSVLPDHNVWVSRLFPFGTLTDKPVQRTLER